MRGVLIAGTGPGAGEAAVADAVTAAEPDASMFATGPDDATAPPAIAARHAGAALEPVAVAEEARAAADGLRVITTSGGLMAPLAERYLNRDLALELRLPVILAAPAGPGLMNGALLALDAARGAGLTVAAIVVTGWPDPPNRVLLDERALLERYTAVPVLGLEGELPIADWLEAEPEAPARVALDPYDAWEERPVGDPRGTSRAEIMKAILEIVAAEGPMRASRAYAVYNRASGGRKLTSVARAPLSSAVYWLAQEHRLLLTRKDEIPWQDDDLVRLPDTPPVRVRELGPRELIEVPLDEIAELANRLRAARGSDDPAELKRAILDTYGLKRLTARADEYLGLALDLAGVT
jgi:hypothetical protein